MFEVNWFVHLSVLITKIQKAISVETAETQLNLQKSLMKYQYWFVHITVENQLICTYHRIIFKKSVFNNGFSANEICFYL